MKNPGISETKSDAEQAGYRPDVEYVPNGRDPAGAQRLPVLVTDAGHTIDSVASIIAWLASAGGEDAAIPRRH